MHWMITNGSVLSLIIVQYIINWPTFQQSHHIELITANLAVVISGYISDKTNSCSVSLLHLFFNKVRTTP